MATQTAKTKSIPGCVHVGGEAPGWKVGMPRTNPPPEGLFWVMHAYEPARKLEEQSKSRYCDGVDKDGNPTWTPLINESAKFTKWTDIKKFWRSTTMKGPKELPMASVKPEQQPFGKGPKQVIRT